MAPAEVLQHGAIWEEHAGRLIVIDGILVYCPHGVVLILTAALPTFPVIEKGVFVGQICYKTGDRAKSEVGIIETIVGAIEEIVQRASHATFKFVFPVN
ncbi:MAG: hypothetical protein PHD58_00815 [Anaerolineales bacterium]|nr:hypothetical protein [Anaerolineales bacterium]